MMPALRPRFSGRDRRALFMGVTFVALSLAATKLLPAWRAWEREVMASAAELAVEADRAGRDAAGLRAARDSLAARSERFLALGPRLVGSGSATLAAASLASLVTEAAAAAGARLGPIQLRSDSAVAGAFRRVGVRGELTGDVRGVTAFLAALERGPALLAVRELSIIQPEPGAPQDRVETLTVQFVVEGVALASSNEKMR